jgi:uncharacterized glyoxalase superfamily protein PhnB
MKLEPLLYVANLRASVAFYLEVLGFDLGEYFPNEADATYASILIDGHKLMLVSADDRPPPFHKHGICGSGVQLFIQVPDVDAIYERVKDKASVVEPLKIKNGETGSSHWLTQTAILFHATRRFERGNSLETPQSRKTAPSNRCIPAM